MILNCVNVVLVVQVTRTPGSPFFQSSLSTVLRLASFHTMSIGLISLQTAAFQSIDEPTLFVSCIYLFIYYLFLLLYLSSSVACILTERRHVHDAVPGDAVLSTPPGRVEPRCSRARSFSRVLNQVALDLPGGHCHSWLRRVFRAAQNVKQWSSALPDRAT